MQRFTHTSEMGIMGRFIAIAGARRPKTQKTGTRTPVTFSRKIAIFSMFCVATICLSFALSFGGIARASTSEDYNAVAPVYNSLDSVYEIQSIEQLRGFRNIVNGDDSLGITPATMRSANVVLMSDITFDGAENWVPIGTPYPALVPFAGTFDGKNHTITNLYVDRVVGYNGLFGYASNATLSNIKFVNPVISSSGTATSGETDARHNGVLLGSGSLANSVIIINNITVNGGSIKSKQAFVGGVAGWVGHGSRVSNCAVTDVVIEGGSSTGGIVGKAYGTTAASATTGGVIVESCLVQSNVMGFAIHVGGIVGMVEGTLISKSAMYGDVIGYSATGGIAGGSQNGVSNFMIHCLVTGDVLINAVNGIDKNNGIYGGGIFGGNWVSGGGMQYCVVTGNVMGYATVGNTANAHTVSGLFGWHNSANSVFNINNCVTSGNLISLNTPTNYGDVVTSTIGVGLNSTSKPTGTNNLYYDDKSVTIAKTADTLATTTVTATAKTIDQLREISTYTGTGGAWPSNVIATDNSAIWRISPDVNNGLPYLHNLGEPDLEKTFLSSTLEIHNLDDLKAFATSVNNGNTYIGKIVRLMEGFEIGDWSNFVIGTETNAFMGTFDGQGKMLTNLIIANASTSNKGLFGYARLATIKNVQIKNVNITAAATNIGAVVGYLDVGGRIENCSVIEGTINGKTALGGVLGYASNALYMEKCFSNANINCDGSSGALLGVLFAGIVTKSYALGNVVAVHPTGSCAAGALTSYLGNKGSITIKDCFSRGNVHATSSKTNSASRTHASGIGGDVSAGSPKKIVNVYTSGTLTAIDNRTYTNMLGAFASGIASTVDNTVTTISNVVVMNGINEGSTAPHVSAKSTGTLTQQNAKIAGSSNATNYAKGTNNLYWDGTQYGANRGIAIPAPTGSSEANTTARSTSDLKRMDTYQAIGWDFNNIWAINANVNNGLPYLKDLPMIGEVDIEYENNYGVKSLTGETVTFTVVADDLNAQLFSHLLWYREGSGWTQVPIVGNSWSFTVNAPGEQVIKIKLSDLDGIETEEYEFTVNILSSIQVSEMRPTVTVTSSDNWTKGTTKAVNFSASTNSGYAVTSYLINQIGMPTGGWLPLVVSSWSGQYTAGTYYVWVRDEIGITSLVKSFTVKNFDNTAPVFKDSAIIKWEYEIKDSNHIMRLIIDRKDFIETQSGLHERPYAFAPDDPESGWTDSITLGAYVDGTFNIYVRDKVGNIGSFELTITNTLFAWIYISYYDDWVANYDDPSSLFEYGWDEFEATIIGDEFTDGLKTIVYDIEQNGALRQEDLVQMVDNASYAYDSLVTFSKQDLQDAINSYHAKQHNYLPETWAQFVQYLYDAQDTVNKNPPMSLQGIDDEIAYLHQKASEILENQVFESPIIQTIETNSTFTFVYEDSTIIDKSLAEYDSDVVVYVYGFKLGESITRVLEEFKNSQYESGKGGIKVLGKDGSEITNLTGVIVATGIQLQLFDSSDTLVDCVVIIVKGDLDGDGVVAASDQTSIQSYLKGGGSVLAGAAFVAADLNCDGVIAAADQTSIDSYLKGNAVIDEGWEL